MKDTSCSKMVPKVTKKVFQEGRQTTETPTAEAERSEGTGNKRRNEPKQKTAKTRNTKLGQLRA